MPNLNLLADDQLPHVEADATYRYLGIAERATFSAAEMRTGVCSEFLRRIKLVCNTALNSINLVRAINAFAVPVVLYSLPLLHWTKADVAGLDRLLRRQLVSCQAHHPRASTLRLYLPRREGGRGFLSIETLAHRGEVRLARYMSGNQDTQLVGILQAHQLSLPPSRSIHHRAMKFLEELGIALPAATKSSVRLAISRRGMSELQDRPLQGQFWRRLNGSGLDASLSLAWLNSPSLRREAEGTIVAAQEQMLATRNFSARISRQIPVADDLCRCCGAPGETLDHLLGCCPALARTSYITRHDSVVRALHWGICKGHGRPDLAASPGRHRLESLVVLPDGVKLFWETTIPTSRHLSANRPDLVIRSRSSVQLVDVSVPLDINVSNKASEKRTKYQPLCQEICRLWSVGTCTVIPIIVGALGGLHSNAPELLKELCPMSVAVLQQWALLGSVAILRTVLHK